MVGCFIGRLYLDSGRSRRGLLAGLRCRGLRPAHSCGVDAQRLLLAASALIRPCCSLRPGGSRARRRPHAEGATRPARDRLRRHRTLVETANKRRNASDSKSRRAAAPPRGGPQLPVAIPADCDPKKYLRPPVARACRCRWALQPISLLGTNPAGRLTRVASTQTNTVSPT